MNDLKLYYTTQEVADHFEVAPSKIRFYEREFHLEVETRGNKKAFTRTDIEKIAEIIALTEEEGLTLPGARERLKKKNRNGEKNELIIQRLKSVREILVRLKGED